MHMLGLCSPAHLRKPHWRMLQTRSNSIPSFLPITFLSSTRPNSAVQDAAAGARVLRAKCGRPKSGVRVPDVLPQQCAAVHRLWLRAAGDDVACKKSG